MNAAKVLDDLKRRFPNEPEYHSEPVCSFATGQARPRAGTLHGF